ncbi:MAG: hypothetical protein KC621_26725 [Myxococcales bacterium]|nr:hypothetical protein [Myxococcales bacterium]
MNRALLLLAAALIGCGEEPGPCDARRDLLQSEAGLVVTELEHPGWGRTECAQCHPVWTYHQADCADGVAIEVDAIDATEPEDCVACHGANGVEEWQEATP